MVTADTRGGDTWFPDIAPWPTSASSNADEIVAAFEAADLTILTFRDTSPSDARLPESPLAAASGDAFTQVPPPDPFVLDHAPSVPRRRPTLFVLGAAAIAVAGVIAIVAAVVVVNTGGDGDQVSADAASVSNTVMSSAPSTGQCATSTTEGHTIGNGPGEQTSGPGVILAFNHAYYVKRDAVTVRALTRGNVTQEAPVLQRYIDAVPAGSSYCLTIDDRGSGLYALKIAVSSPGVAPQVIPQIVQTTEADGKTWITSILKDETTPA